MIGNITTEQTSKTVGTIRIPLKKNKHWEQWVLLSADRHIDNPKSNVLMQKRHLEEAKERGAIVIDCGDLFDAMQGKFDPRSCKDDLGEHAQGDYLDSLVEQADKLFSKYADNIASIGYGNHETAILKRHETDLIKRLVFRLKNKNQGVLLGGYRGWIRLMFEGEKGSHRQSFNLYYSHGSGGNSPVTKGVIRTNRRSVYLPDADIVCAGHIHEAWTFPVTRSRISNAGVEYVDEQLHIQIPTYKEEFLEENKGFHHEKEGPPKPIGAWWLRFWWSIKPKHTIMFDAIRAR